MTHTIHRGRSRRTVRAAAALGAATLGLAALSACEKPTPRATVTVGSDSVSTEAAADCYSEDEALDQKAVLACAKDGKAEQSITVGEGETVRIGADPEITEKGWMLLVNGQPVPMPAEKTYRSIPGDALFQQQQSPTGGGGGRASSVRLSVVQADGSEYHGVWNVELKSE